MVHMMFLQWFLDAAYLVPPITLEGTLLEMATDGTIPCTILE